MALNPQTEYDMASIPTPPRKTTHHGRTCYVTRWRGDLIEGKRAEHANRWYVETEQEAIKLYAVWLNEWERNPHVRNPSTQTVSTVADLSVVYYEYAKATYQKRGTPTSYVANIKGALGVLIAKQGDLPAGKLTPPMLANVRDAMIVTEDGETLTRKTVNMRVDCIRAMYRWAVEKGHVDANTWHGLKAVSSLRKGRSLATESVGVQPIHESTVAETLIHLSPVVADMIRLQAMTGMRPDEVCTMRPIDIEHGGDVWLYRPADPKLAHLDQARTRVVCLGPKAQAIIQPYLQRDLVAFLFNPKESNAWRNAAASTHRRVDQKPTPKLTNRVVGDRYTSASYRRAIHRACDNAFDPARALRGAGDTSYRWSPNQLRHSYATQLRKQFGIEATSISLGHSNISTTELYAEKAVQHAMKIARDVG